MFFCLIFLYLFCALFCALFCSLFGILRNFYRNFPFVCVCECFSFSVYFLVFCNVCVIEICSCDLLTVCVSYNLELIYSFCFEFCWFNTFWCAFLFVICMLFSVVFVCFLTIFDVFCFIFFISYSFGVYCYALNFEISLNTNADARMIMFGIANLVVLVVLASVFMFLIYCSIFTMTLFYCLYLQEKKNDGFNRILLYVCLCSSTISGFHRGKTKLYFIFLQCFSICFSLVRLFWTLILCVSVCVCEFLIFNLYFYSLFELEWKIGIAIVVLLVVIWKFVVVVSGGGCISYNLWVEFSESLSLFISLHWNYYFLHIAVVYLLSWKIVSH